MQLGFFTMPIHPPSRSLTETLKEDRELVLLAEELEFTEGFIGEHITDGAENITSPLIFIAWLLRETSRIKLGTGTVNLPIHHPAVVAAEVAMIDHMAELLKVNFKMKYYTILEQFCNSANTFPHVGPNHISLLELVM